MYYKKIFREIEDYMTAQPSNANKYADDELVHPLDRLGCYNFSPKSASLWKLSCVTFAIYNLVH